MRIKWDDICQTLILVPVQAFKKILYVLANGIPLYQAIASYNTSKK